MSDMIQQKIDQIISDRQQRLTVVEKEKSSWDSLAVEFNALRDSAMEAERLNTGELSGLTQQVRQAASAIREQRDRFDQIVQRFNRKEICIGIGGAGRMGKSTFLQAVTGLGEQQIPTSDMFYTTAGRSLIVNSPEAVAIADMHSEATFLRDVLAPLCQEVGVDAPGSLEEFQRMQWPEADTQTKIDVINRLEDTKQAMMMLRSELTGQQQRRIPLNDLRKYVAYPDDGKSKAGAFMAIKSIVIYAPFPNSSAKQLKVVDLPGLGEAGRNLATLHTNGMAEICDITLLMKRPDEKNVAWNLNDTNALDAMKAAAPLLNDQTLYTAILANVNGERPERAEACVEDIQNQLQKQGRSFQIIRCNAKDRDSVLSETMPKVLDFLARNLPQIDQAIYQKAIQNSKETQEEIRRLLKTVKEQLNGVIGKNSDSDYGFADNMYNAILQSLSLCADKLNAAAQTTDEEWNREVQRVSDLVKSWIKDGCGYSSTEELTKKLHDEILKRKGQPSDIINNLRIEFRKQWEIIDEHLQDRIAAVLEAFIDAIRKHTCAFIPQAQSNDGSNRLEAARQLLRDLADKLRNTPDQEVGDDEALDDLITPLERLSVFDLRFRFHLEPTLKCASDVLTPNHPGLQTSDHNEAAALAQRLQKMLTETVDAYSKNMCASRSGSAMAKLERIVKAVVANKCDQKDLLDEMRSMGEVSLSFSPNRILYAVVDNAVDAFTRSENTHRAFHAWVRGYKRQLKEPPTPQLQSATQAYAHCDKVTKMLG